MGRVLLASMTLGMLTGCCANRHYGVLPRTGELFYSTRSNEENNGMPFAALGCLTYPIGTVVFFPMAAVVGVADQFVFSPVWDVLCLPSDLMTPTYHFKVMDECGNPVTGAHLTEYGPRSDENGLLTVRIKESRAKDDKLDVCFSEDGYYEEATFDHTDRREQVLMKPGNKRESRK